MAVAAGRLGWGQLSSSRLVWVVGFSRAVRGRVQMLRYVSNLCLRYVGCYPVGKASFKASRNSQGGGRFIPLLEALSSYTAMA